MWTIIKTLGSTAVSFLAGGGIGVYLLCAGVGLSAGGVAGWTVNGWRWEAREAALTRSYDEARDKAVQEAAARRARVADAYARLDAEHTKEMTDAQARIDDLRRDVAAGRKRLRVAARCPAPAAMPGAGGGARVGDAAAPELEGAAREDYYALVGRLELMEAQLRAAQDALKAERAAK